MNRKKCVALLFLFALLPSPAAAVKDISIDWETGEVTVTGEPVEEVEGGEDDREEGLDAERRIERLKRIVERQQKVIRGQREVIERQRRELRRKENIIRGLDQLRRKGM